MNNPTAMITGASRGLGRALAAGLAREGYALIIDARNAAGLDAAADRIRAAGGTVTAIAGDVTDPAHRAALRQAAEAAGRLDLLVNNAGTLGASPLPALADYPPDELRAAFEVNVIAPIALTQVVLPLLRASGGAVLNITSDAAEEPTRAGAATARPRRPWSRPRTCWPPRSSRSGSGGPIPATCAPTCTSWPSPAKTSRTARSPSRSSPRSSGSSRSACRAAGTARLT